MNLLKNLIFDIGGVVTLDIEARAFDHLSTLEQEKLNNLVFYDKRIYEVLLGNLTCEEYKFQLLNENVKYQEEIDELLNIKFQNKFIPKDEKVVQLLYDLKKKYKRID